MFGPDGLRWLSLFKTELDNIRAALEFGKEHDLEAAFRIAGATGDYWRHSGLLTEGGEWTESLLIKDGRVPAIVKVKAISFATFLVGYQGNNRRAIELCEYGLALSRETGDKQGILWSLAPLGNFLLRSGRPEPSLKTCEESVALAREIDDKHSLLRALSNLGLTLALREDFARADTFFKEGLSIARELGSKFYETNFLIALGRSACRQHDYIQTTTLLKDALNIARRIGSKFYLVQPFELLGTAAILGDRLPKRAATLFGADDVLREEMGFIQADEYYRNYIRDIHENLNEEAFNAAWEEGRKMTLDEAVEYALGDD